MQDNILIIYQINKVFKFQALVNIRSAIVCLSSKQHLLVNLKVRTAFISITRGTPQVKCQRERGGALAVFEPIPQCTLISTFLTQKISLMLTLSKKKKKSNTYVWTSWKNYWATFNSIWIY